MLEPSPQKRRKPRGPKISSKKRFEKACSSYPLVVKWVGKGLFDGMVIGGTFGTKAHFGDIFLFARRGYAGSMTIEVLVETNVVGVLVEKHTEILYDHNQPR